MTIEYNKVTWYSKLLALILFVALPFIGFYLGMKYAEMKDKVQWAREYVKEQMEIVEDETNISTSSGRLMGKVSIGPICPVEREGVPCEVNPEVYTSRKAIVYKSDQKTVVQEKNLNLDGTYEFSLPDGTYYVNVIPQGIGTLPVKEVIISEGRTVELNFDIDTGIR